MTTISELIIARADTGGGNSSSKIGDGIDIDELGNMFALQAYLLSHATKENLQVNQFGWTDNKDDNILAFSKNELDNYKKYFRLSAKVSPDFSQGSISGHELALAAFQSL
ncbi:MAG: hypothetical protein V4691_08585, partial [Pseudomonadota bacterium]